MSMFQNQPDYILKRDDSSQRFDVARIVAAIQKVQRAAGMDDDDLAHELGDVVIEHLHSICEGSTPNIEDVQDAVVYVLQESGHYNLAQLYIRYRDNRERDRRRSWAQGDERAVNPHLNIMSRDGRVRAWDNARLQAYLCAHYNLSEKLCADVVHRVECLLAECDCTELDGHVLLSFVDTALCQCGAEQGTLRHADVRVDQHALQTAFENAPHGFALQQTAAAESLHTWSLVGHYTPEVIRLYSSGRLWIDGLNDPLRGSHFVTNFSGRSDPWEVISRAATVALDAQQHWQNISLILPPMILGQLEQHLEGDSETTETCTALLAALESLASIAQVYLYSNGGTPLLSEWPFVRKNIGLATFEDDFLLQARLQELGAPMLTGVHLQQAGYRRRVAVRLAINAQGLEGNYSRMDHLAMALVAAVQVRRQQLKNNPEAQGAEIRFAIYGLPPHSSSNEYLERQVIQEGLRADIALSRSANLTDNACQHLARLFE